MGDAMTPARFAEKRRNDAIKLQRASCDGAASKPPGGSKYTSAYGWSTNPKGVWTAAKAKALSCLDEEDPKLTALELAFWRRLKGDWQTEQAHPRSLGR